MNLCDYQEISALKPSKVRDSEILDFLIDNAIGKENAVPGSKIAQVFGYDNSSQVRIHIRRLRNNKNIDLKIGSSSKGYYLPREDEEMESVKMLFEKTLSHIETLINQAPSVANILHKAIGFHYKKADKTANKQLRFNDKMELEYAKRFAEKEQQ